MDPENENKKHIMQNKYVLKNVLTRMSEMEEENKFFKRRNEDKNEVIKQEKLAYNQIIEKLTEDLNKTVQEKNQFELQCENIQSQIDILREENIRKIRIQNEKYAAEGALQEQKLKGLLGRLESIETYLEKKTEMEEEIKNLQEKIDKERAQRRLEVADKDREKVQATDKLKKDMQVKIKETETSLKALKKEQLQTTTKLTVLQNHQLTTELEYQSKQTESLLFKNSKLQESVITLKRDIEIHKQVEQELAKRSHHYQNIIKKLTNQVKIIEDENNLFNHLPNNTDNLNPNQTKTKEEIIKFLEKNLDNQEKKMAKLQNDYEILKGENQMYLIQKQQQQQQQQIYSQVSKMNVSQLLADWIQNIKQAELQIQQYFNNEQLNSLTLKTIQDLTIDEKRQFINIILESLKPYIAFKNKSQMQLQNSFASSSIKILDIDKQDKILNQISLPKLIGNQGSMQSNNNSKQKIRGMPNELNQKIGLNNMHHNYSLRKL